MDNTLTNEIIKHQETKPNEQDIYREYSVYKKDSKFIFESLEWNIINNRKRMGLRKDWEEFQDEKNAIAKYEEVVSV